GRNQWGLHFGRGFLILRRRGDPHNLGRVQCRDVPDRTAFGGRRRIPWECSRTGYFSSSGSCGLENRDFHCLSWEWVFIYRLVGETGGPEAQGGDWGGRFFSVL